MHKENIIPFSNEDPVGRPGGILCAYLECAAEFVGGTSQADRQRHMESAR